MSRFETEATALDGVVRIRRKPVADARGFLERIYCEQDLAGILGQRRIAQINHTLTREQGTIRGMHFQHPPDADSKMVFCLKGRIFDVALDLRRESPTFLKWYGKVLTDQDALFIPEGFAHGFQTLEPDCELIYLHGAPYSPSREGAVHALDPALAIDWPLAAGILSDRDRSHRFIEPSFTGISL